MRKLNKKYNYPRFRGFTLVEIIVTLGVLSIVILGIYSFLVEIIKFQNFVSEQNAAISIARNGIEQIIQELREADISDTGAYPIALANAQELVFYSDIDNDLLTEKVRYFLDGINLKKGIIEATYDPLADPPYSYLGDEEIKNISLSVQNSAEPIFSYYNGDYPGDTINNPLPYPVNVTEVKLIKINLQININPYRVPDTYLLENYVQLRNLKENL